jgi:hypothetical protein
MIGFIVSVFPFRNRVSSKEAFEVLELGEGKLSRPVLRGPGGRKAAWLLGQLLLHKSIFPVTALTTGLNPALLRSKEFRALLSVYNQAKVICKGGPSCPFRGWRQLFCWPS